MEFTSEDFFGRDEDGTQDKFFRALEATSGIVSLGRKTSRTVAVLMYGLSQGYSLDDMKAMTKDERLKLGAGVTDFMRKYPTSEEVNKSEADRQGTYWAYGRFFREAAEQFLKEKLPVVDSNDPEDVKRNMDRLSTIALFGQDFSQLKEKRNGSGLTNNEFFIRAFGGPDKLDDIEVKIQALTDQTNILRQAYPEGPDMEPGNVAANCFLARRYARQFKEMGGRTLNEAGADFGKGIWGYANREQMKVIPAVGMKYGDRKQRRLVMAYARGEKDPQGKDIELFSPKELRQLEKDAEKQVKQLRENQEKRISQLRNPSDTDLDRVFDSWYLSKEAEVKKKLHQQEMEAWKQGEITANMLQGGGKNSASMRLLQRRREDRLPFINEKDQLLASFVLSTLDRFIKETDVDLRESTYEEMHADLLRGRMDKRLPDSGARTELQVKLNGLLRKTGARIYGTTNEMYMQSYLEIVYDQLSGDAPAKDKKGLSPAENYYNGLPDSVREYIDNELRDALKKRAPLALKDLDPDDLMDMWPSGPANQPSKVTMRFEEVAEINAKELAAHIANPKKLTNLERDYALAAFEQTFAPLMTETQKTRLEGGGMDLFDVITIDGQSVRERFGEKYRDLKPEEQERMFQMETVAAGLKSDARIVFATMEEQPDHSMEFSRPIAVKRGGELHEPKPTMGERFLNFFGIRRIVSIKEQWEKANDQAALGKGDFENRIPGLQGRIEEASRAGRARATGAEPEHLQKGEASGHRSKISMEELNHKVNGEAAKRRVRSNFQEVSGKKGPSLNSGPKR